MNRNIIYQKVQKIIDIKYFSRYTKNDVVIFYEILCSSIDCINIFYVMEFSDVGKA